VSECVCLCVSVCVCVSRPIVDVDISSCVGDVYPSYQNRGWPILISTSENKESHVRDDV
jgi:hypothetical protein